MSDYTLETITSEDKPDERVRIVADLDPMQPYGDALAPALLVDGTSSGSWTQWHEWASEVYQPKDADAIVRAWRHFDIDRFERWLRIYQGTTTLRVVSGYTYRSSPDVIVFDTADYREHVGLPADDNSEDLLSGEEAEWRAWLDGDVYGLVHEQHRTGHVSWSDDTEDDIDEWNMIDSSWGYFGTEYAEQTAREWLA